MHKVSAEDRNKFAIMGVITYILLLPWVIAFIHFIWNPPEGNEALSWIFYFSVVIVINLFDDCIGEVIYWIKGRK